MNSPIAEKFREEYALRREARDIFRKLIHGFDEEKAKMLSEMDSGRVWTVQGFIDEMDVNNYRIAEIEDESFLIWENNDRK